ncbi:hypothetical protein [Streptomyces sp. JJ36]|uniref:hypothetical protein n=1 Tax=Streptomyces sp. JJ36 TaxID=2736645 RepID=UPI001F443D94|nr:hypothetical protein [Streptomyces sp. JJ36]MCF6523050.1 hypothetical protein [Streptomyces sp. JJ36]
MTTERNDGTHDDTEASLHRLLTGILRRLDTPAREALLHAVDSELHARDARAYASGWQDAVASLTTAPPPQ